MAAKTKRRPSKKVWTATELRKLPPAKRDAILLAAARRAAKQYRTNPELTAFEAYGRSDLHVNSSNTDLIQFCKARQTKTPLKSSYS